MDLPDETPPTSPRTPLAAYPLLSRSRAPEFYGFAALSGTSVLFVLYHLWALLPDEWIVNAGVDWYPSRSVLGDSLLVAMLKC